MSQDKDTKIGITVEQISVDQSQLGNDADYERLVILPTKNVVLFPEVTISMALTRPVSEQAARYAYDNKEPLGVVCQTDPDDEKPTLKGLYSVGVIADVVKIIELPGGETTAIVRGREAFKINKSGIKRGLPRMLVVANVTPLPEIDDTDEGYTVLIKEVQDLIKKVAPKINDGLAAFMPTLWQSESPQNVVNIIAANFPLDSDKKQELLMMRSAKERASGLLRMLAVKMQEIEFTAEILQRAHAELDDDQRRAIMQRQIDVLNQELYGDTDDISDFEHRAEQINLPQAVRQTFDKEVNKLRRLNPQSPDYSVIYTYLDTILGLPWGKETELNRDFGNAREALEQDHCGLEKVKERILEQLAVLMHKPNGKAPIICLVGPPGVGKTSLGQSIAQALGRDYQRVSLGGLHDEAEIRGHRRTYIGAMPGRIIQAMQRSNSANPVMVLDEVDKIGADYKGDPAAALLEVLDPEQNCHFHDNYIDVDFDLSHVLFIATANSLSTIAKPLLDRMEIIEIGGYLPEEKIEIARKHLMRRLFAELDIAPDAFAISDRALGAIIDEYTSESGVRQLDKRLATIARKYLLAKMSGKDFPAVVEPEHLKDILGLAPYQHDKYETNEYAGVVTGLAWTEAGGQILLAEATLVPGKGELTITGNLGQVMKESATLAYQWVRANANVLGITVDMDKHNVHLHFPEGAIPKDGPSAGITIATAMVSAMKQKRVRERLAMTGEITLRGKVLPVGGIKEKILAAKRAGITDIVLSADNRKDVEDIDPKYVAGLTMHYVENALQVIDYAVTDLDTADIKPS